MHLARAALLLTFLSTCNLLLAEEPLSLPDLIEAVEPAVVLIETDAALGSGFLVDDTGIIVTNHHVMREALEGKVTFADKQSFNIEGVLFDDPTRDIAIIKINSSRPDILDIASSLPRKGEKVYTLGAPRGYNFSISDGIVSAIREKFNDMQGTWIQTTAPISSGNSGGPLFNGDGEVVGMNTFGRRDGQNLNFAISCIDIENALDEADKVESPTPLDKVVASSEAISKKIRQTQASDAMLREFFNESAQLGKTAIAECKKLIQQQSDLLVLAKRGTVNPNAPFNTSKGVLLVVDGGKKISITFRDQATKTSVVEEFSDDLVASKEHLAELQDSLKGTLTCALYFGPILEFNQIGDIGRIRKFKIISIKDDAVIGMTDQNRLIAVLGVDASDVEKDEEIENAVFVYAGEETVKARGGTKQKIFIVALLPTEELTERYSKLYPNGSAASAKASKAGPSRQWKGNDGKFSIKAKFIRLDGDNVYLQPDSGLTIKFPLDNLSTEDKKWILDYLE